MHYKKSWLRYITLHSADLRSFSYFKIIAVQYTQEFEKIKRMCSFFTDIRDEKRENSAACFSRNFIFLINQETVSFRWKALLDFSAHWFVSFKTFQDSCKFLFTKGITEKKSVLWMFGKSADKTPSQYTIDYLNTNIHQISRKTWSRF